MTLREQFRNITLILVIIYGATTALLSIVIFWGIQFNIELDHFTQDPAEITNSPFYLGFFSNVGIMLWCASAAISLLASRVIPATESKSRVRRFLFVSGLLSILLMLDDLFQLHEEVFPFYFGIPENAVYLVYANVILLYAVIYRDLLINSEYLLLLLAALLIGTSRIIDVVPMPIPEDSFLEDAIKLFGIVSWFLFYVRYSFSEIKKLV
ncbi:MAG: hypothetical protein LC117_06815 [Bacteroidia bacterium]|nr:hypothetical protein [Bacteroidia bacterium]MCZ2277623.1 hypothetical protein [Bacteroidia bacterium]